ncbi:PAS domain-containing hybrid sensor histidine kinase/response regulator [Pseudorhodoferax sp. Leaf267]|uniref:hybrid sensor histidine kinase/response regulator n=1 Tax=Pseudorhodoferax sp. Leaf267 TaxID=1736316 RepID=UPI0006FD7159|nr:PAS domain-containing hybrid sensor histidine kinase/response regulator [Pseudorhodoferax sp. Leaf267]KQP18260.1 hypothetical protein ASF43_10560 [Pseudorhodoferax sp. Leaf267]
MDPAPPDFDALPIGVLSVDLGGRVLAANACLAGWLGQPAAALAGLHVDQLLTHGGRVLYHTYLLTTLRMRGQVQELTLALDARDGPIHVLTCASLRSEGGTSVVQLAFSPMRERLRVEAELQRVQRAADAAPALLFAYERDRSGAGRFTYASAGLRTLYGLAPGSVCDADRAVWEQVHPDDRAGLLAARDAAQAAGRLWEFRYRARRDLAQPWSWHALRATSGGSLDGCTVWHGTVSDVTRDLALQEAALERDVAAQASKAKSEFLARMSHELRTPLNGIIGFSRLLAADTQRPLDVEQSRRVQLIESSGHLLLSLIDEVLDIARIEAGRLQLHLGPVPLAPLLQRAVAALEPTMLAHGVTATVDCPPDFAVHADGSRLEQVLSNLLSNAVKYNRPGGRITVSAVASEADRVAIAVQDTGHGLTEDQLRQMFQPFNRLGAEKTRTEGVGLGLVITRSLVEAMQGSVGVQSVAGAGTTFTVVLPRAQAALPASTVACAEANDAAAQGAPRRVLCAEDNPVNATLMQAVLEVLPGVEVYIGATGEDTLRDAALHPPHLLLLDVQLPDMDGYELLRRLRALPGLAQTPAVVVSADAMPEDLARAKAHGCVAYWTKPISVERVRAEVRRMLAGGG